MTYRTFLLRKRDMGLTRLIQPNGWRGQKRCLPRGHWNLEFENFQDFYKENILLPVDGQVQSHELSEHGIFVTNHFSKVVGPILKHRNSFEMRFFMVINLRNYGNYSEIFCHMDWFADKANSNNVGKRHHLWKAVKLIVI